MHAVLVTFQSSVPIEALAEPFAAYADEMTRVSGLICKTWIKDGDTLGGFHVFANRSDADRYLESDLVAGLTSNDAFDDFNIDRYDVIDELSIVTGTPNTPVAAKAREILSGH